MEILTFMKDWVPTVGILVGAIWVLVIKLYDETSKAKREITSLESELTYSRCDLDSKKTIVEIVATWNNKSSKPINVDLQKSKIEIFKIPIISEVGSLDIHINESHKIITEYPFINDRFYMLEPNTCSKLVNHFVINTEMLYLLRWHLIGQSEIDYWYKELLIDIRN